MLYSVAATLFFAAMSRFMLGAMPARSLLDDASAAS